MLRTIICLAALAVSCSSDTDTNDGSAWQFAGDAGEGPADLGGAQNNIAPNNRDPNNIQRPIDAGPVPGCESEIDVQLVDGPLFNESSNPIKIAPDAWWFLRGDEFGGQQLTRQVDLHGESEMFRRDVVALLGAGAAGALFIADNSVILLDPESGEERRLARAEGARPWESAGFATAARRFVGDEVAAWEHQGVWIATATNVAQVTMTSGVIPYVRDNAVVYAEPDGFLTVWENTRRYQLSEPNPLNLALSRSHLFFVRSGGGLMSVPRDGLAMAQPAPVLPAPGGCNGLAVSDDGRELLAACFVDDASSATALFYSTNGTDWTLRAEAPGELHHTYAVGGGWIAYANYNNTPPMMVLVSPDGEQTEISAIGQACLSCGAYWPPNYVEIRNGRVAWNYAVEEPGREPGQQQLGMATLCASP